MRGKLLPGFYGTLGPGGVMITSFVDYVITGIATLCE